MKAEDLSGTRTMIYLLDGTIRGLHEAYAHVETQYVTGSVLVKCMENQLYGVGLCIYRKLLSQKAAYAHELKRTMSNGARGHEKRPLPSLKRPKSCTESKVKRWKIRNMFGGSKHFIRPGAFGCMRKPKCRGVPV